MPDVPDGAGRHAECDVKSAGRDAGNAVSNYLKLLPALPASSYRCPPSYMSALNHLEYI